MARRDAGKPPDQSEAWQPLSTRDAAPKDLREGPTVLETELRKCLNQLYPKQDQIDEVCSRLNLKLTVTDDLASGMPTDKLLDVADALLDVLPQTKNPLTAYVFEGIDCWLYRRRLREVLDYAGSVYQVKQDGSGLERRVNPIAVAALDAAMAGARAKPDAGSAAAQLNAADDALHALKPDTANAYSLAIKAVESAAHAIVDPNEAKVTLSRLCRKMRSNPDTFELAILGPEGNGDIAPVIGMMTLLWKGQSSRHGAQTPTVDESREAAEMAVQLASVLVLWFTTGMIRRKTPQVGKS